MSGRSRPLDRQRMPALAGWLFADLFLMLFVVGLASLPAHRVSHPPPRPKPHPTRSVSPRVLDRWPVRFAILVPPSAVQDPATRGQAIAQILRDLNDTLAAQRLQARQAGFVLVFASGPVTGIGPAVATAGQVLRVVRGRDATFAGTSGQGFWTGTGDEFQFEIFFFA